MQGNQALNKKHSIPINLSSTNPLNHNTTHLGAREGLKDKWYGKRIWLMGIEVEKVAEREVEKSGDRKRIETEG